MAKVGVETRLGSLPTYVYPSGIGGVSGYDQNKLGLGPLITQLNGAQAEDKFAGPFPIAVGRPFESAAAAAAASPWAMQWSPTEDWVFLADQATAAATRRILMYTFNKTSQTLAFEGFITVTFPTATTYTIRGFRMTYDKYTTGTVSGTINGSGISGNGTTWQTDRLAAGSRIGFCSTNPNTISGSWYEVSAITSNTTLNLSTVLASEVSIGSPYVIEELRAVMATTNATATNGGLTVVKGLQRAAFSSIGTAVPAATTVDNIRACYWLADASTVLNTVTTGMGLQERETWQTHKAWVMDTIANPILYNYNLRKNLTLTAGKDTTSLILKTGAGGAVTGTTSQANNGRIANTGHGPGAGSDCLYFTTTTRVYRTIPVDSITSLQTTWLSGGDAMTEVPPGGVATFPLTALMNSIEYSAILDRFMIMSSAAAGIRNYITQYNSAGNQFDRLFTADIKHYPQSTADASAPNTLTNPPITALSAWAEGGLGYFCGLGTTALTNILYVAPIGADMEYAPITKNRLVLPKMLTPNCAKYSRLYVIRIKEVGGTTPKQLGQPCEAFRSYYRTAGISDDSGTWNLLDDTGDLSGVGAASEIQIMCEFKTISALGIPARILGACVLYEDLSTDSHYNPCADLSDKTNKRFAWWFGTAFGGTVPTLRVRLYNAVTGGILVDDTSSAPTGTWEKSVNSGGAWSAYDTTDKANDLTFIRYTPASLGDNINVRALLTQN